MRGNVLIVVELAVGERSVREKDNGVTGRTGDLVGAGKLGVDILGLIERDPGIEAATDDLYEAAAAFLAEVTASTPLARHLRLLREARLRYRERLSGARPGERMP